MVAPRMPPLGVRGFLFKNFCELLTIRLEGANLYPDYSDIGARPRPPSVGTHTVRGMDEDSTLSPLVRPLSVTPLRRIRVE